MVADWALVEDERGYKRKRKKLCTVYGVARRRETETLLGPWVKTENYRIQLAKFDPWYK